MTEWRDYQQLVLAELRRLNENIEKISDKTARNERDIAVIKVRSGFWGSISAIATVAIALFIEWIYRKI